jgi:hypothetical protein
MEMFRSVDCEKHRMILYTDAFPDGKGQDPAYGKKPEVFGTYGVTTLGQIMGYSV